MPMNYQPTDEQIRTKAYYLWEADGRPQNRDWDYWIKAKEQLEREVSGANGQTRKSSNSTTAEKPASKRTSRSPVYA
jgi:hypothetical protein